MVDMVQNRDNKKIIDVGQIAFRINMLNNASGLVPIAGTVLNYNPFIFKLNGRDLFYLGR